MSELTPRARALLEAARNNHGPNQDDRDRVLAGLHVSLGIAGALPVLCDTTPANAVSSSGPQLVQPPLPHAPSIPPPPPALPQVLVKPAASKALGFGKLLAWKAGKVYLATLVIGGTVAGVSMMPRGDDAARARRGAAIVAPREEQPKAALEPAVVEAAAEAAPMVAAAAIEAPAAEAPAAEAPAVMAARAEAARTDGVAPTADVQRAAEKRASTREARVAAVSTAPGRTARSARSHSRHQSRRRAREERELLSQDNTPEPKHAEKPVEEATTATALGVANPPSPELALIRSALTSLRDHDSLQALRLLDEHAARYPSGAFGTERRALHVVALCAAGRTEEGARERAQFLKTSGDSPIAARVRSACPR